jgi:hypothetical protein
MEIVSKEQFAALILDEDVAFDERKELVIKEFGITLPDEIQDGEPFLEHVYGIYQLAIEKYKLTEKMMYRKEEKPKEREGTIKEFIIKTIIEEKNLLITGLHKIINEAYPDRYVKQGKNSRTRCRKVIDQLKLENKLEETKDKRIIWKD